MRQLAAEALGSKHPSVANLIYGKLCQRLASVLTWEPERREDGSPIWLTTAAEGWQPPQREFEWVIVPSLQNLFV